jgi:hypothetical protein
MKIRVFSVSDGVAHEEPVPQVVQDILHQLEQNEIEQEFNTPSYVDSNRATFVAEAPEQTLQALKDLGYHVEGGK